MLKNTTLVYFGLNAIFCIGTKTIICGDQNTPMLDRHDSLLHIVAQ